MRKMPRNAEKLEKLKIDDDGNINGIRKSYNHFIQLSGTNCRIYLTLTTSNPAKFTIDSLKSYFVAVVKRASCSGFLEGKLAQYFGGDGDTFSIGVFNTGTGTITTYTTIFTSITDYAEPI